VSGTISSAGCSFIAYGATTKDIKMKILITAIILAFTITNANSQSMTCRPQPNGSTICVPNAAPSSAGLASGLVAAVALYFLVKYLRDKPDNQPDNTNQ
jgi:hypothetical protein